MQIPSAKNPSFMRRLLANLPAWKASIGVMNVIYVSGGCAALFYFLHVNSSKTLGIFKSENIKMNTLLILVMSVFNYTASVTFSYAASALGPEAGGTVGYAIFNAGCSHGHSRRFNCW